MRTKVGTVVRLLDSLRDKAAGEVQVLYAQVERENAELMMLSPELAATLAGELRCLQTILHGVIAEQVARLR